MKQIIVAIDGYSSCGKSTIAKQLAQYAGYRYIDTGAMYRAAALFAIRNKISDFSSQISLHCCHRCISILLSSLMAHST